METFIRHTPWPTSQASQINKSNRRICMYTSPISGVILHIEIYLETVSLFVVVAFGRNWIHTCIIGYTFKKAGWFLYSFRVSGEISFYLRCRVEIREGKGRELAIYLGSNYAWNAFVCFYIMWMEFMNHHHHHHHHLVFVYVHSPDALWAFDVFLCLSG